MMACSVAAALGCGGGGGGGGDSGGAGASSGSGSTLPLNATVSYDAVDASLFTPVSARPHVSGADAAAVHCSVTQGALPPGVVLGSDCALSGTPTAVGSYGATVALSADGRSGSATASVAVTVAAPKLAAVNPGTTQSPGLSLQIGSPVDAVTVVTLQDYVPKTGDTLGYTVTGGSLPAGIALDPATGTLSGVPTGYGPSTADITVTIHHGDSGYQTPPIPITVNVVQAALTLSYPNCCKANMGVPLAAAATSSYVPVAGGSSRFSAAGVPPGLVLDAASGALSGTPTTPGTYPVTIDQAVALPNGVAMTARAVVSVVVGGVYPVYQVIGLDAIQPGQSFSVDRVGFLGGIGGDVYTTSLRAAPGSTASGNLTASPVPDWLHIDPATGRIFGTRPPAGSPNYQYELEIVLTVVRNGAPYSTTTSLSITFKDV